MERVIGGLGSLQHRRNASPDADKYCIHFPFIIDISSTKAVPAAANVHEREEADEDHQI